MGSISSSIDQAIESEEKKEFFASIKYWSCALEEDSHPRGLVNYRMGHAYLLGIGVEKNEEKGIECFLRSAYLDYQGGKAMYYYYGLGVPKDHLKAAFYFRSLANSNNDPIAHFMLGHMCLVDRLESLAKSHFEKAIDAGHPGAMIALAHMYRTGTGVEKNLQRMADNLKLAAETGYGLAQYLYGFFLRYESSEPERLEKAFHFFQSAMDLGNKCAISEIASFSENG